MGRGVAGGEVQHHPAAAGSVARHRDSRPRKLPQHVAPAVRLLQQEAERLGLSRRAAQQRLGQGDLHGVIVGGVGHGDRHAAAYRYFSGGCGGYGLPLRRDGGGIAGAEALRRRLRYRVGRACQQTGKHRCLTMGQRHNAHRLHAAALPVHRVGRPRRDGAAAQRYGDVKRLPVGADGALRYLLCHPQLA